MRCCLNILSHAALAICDMVKLIPENYHILTQLFRCFCKSRKCYGTFENFLNSIILQCNFIVQKHLSTTLTLRQLILQELGIGVEFMEACIIQPDNIC